MNVLINHRWLNGAQFVVGISKSAATQVALFIHMAPLTYLATYKQKLSDCSLTFRKVATSPQIQAIKIRSAPCAHSSFHFHIASE